MAKERHSLPPPPVVHAATSWEGGAGIAAERIVAAERTVGLDAKVVFRSQGDEPGPLQSEILKLSGPQQSLSSAVTFANRLATRRPSVLFSPLSSSPCTAALQRRSAGKILHLHNIYNMVSVFDLLKFNEAVGIVATLHDERLLTAACHAALGCDGTLRGCRQCPQSRVPMVLPRRGSQRKQIDILANMDVQLIAPSEWMHGRALAAGVKQDTLHVIPNPIDVDLFSPFGARHDLVEASRSPSTWTLAWLPGKDDVTFWSGVVAAQKELRRSGSRIEMRVLTVTTAEAPPDVPVIRVAPPQTEEQRATFWRSADLAVSVTRADNFPNIVLEAIAVGTPVCISDVGGAAEAVRATGGGRVITGSDSGPVAAALIEAALRREALSMHMPAARSLLKELYSYERIGERYAHLYQDLAARKAQDAKSVRP